MLKTKIKNLFSKINDEFLLDRNKRKYLELFIISLVFFLAGTVFTIINFITNEHVLGYVTLSFGVLSLITLLIIVIKPEWFTFAQAVFVLGTMIMFVYFMVAGGAGDNGFSTYWILLLPFISMMILGLKVGSLITGIMFVLICLMLWVPAIRENLLRWTPDPTFTTRFPLVYLAAFAASALFEYSRYLVDKANKKLNNTLRNIASHDTLTGLTNRTGLNEFLKNFDFTKNEFNEEVQIANCLLIDVDDFKSANDLYGHFFGDEVLVEISKILYKYAGEHAIRFGGDEFILLFVNKSQEEMFEIGENIRKEVENITYKDHPGVKFTISVGIASHEVTLSYNLNHVIELADNESAKAKKSGKNAVFILDYDEQIKKPKVKKLN